jgi:hypothetical protein
MHKGLLEENVALNPFKLFLTFYFVLFGVTFTGENLITL